MVQHPKYTHKGELPAFQTKLEYIPPFHSKCNRLQTGACSYYTYVGMTLCGTGTSALMNESQMLIRGVSLSGDIGCIYSFYWSRNAIPYIRLHSVGYRTLW